MVSILSAHQNDSGRLYTVSLALRLNGRVEVYSDFEFAHAFDVSGVS